MTERARPEYIMAHSLSHALMSEVAIDCGYPASALKERIYVLPRSPAGGRRSAAGCSSTPPPPAIKGRRAASSKSRTGSGASLKSALERARLCSGDPVCADHDPVHAQGDRMLHGAACHGCLLVSETSCEARNVSLDRALLVDTVGTVGAAFF